MSNNQKRIQNLQAVNRIRTLESEIETLKATIQELQIVVAKQTMLLDQLTDTPAPHSYIRHLGIG